MILNASMEKASSSLGRRKNLFACVNVDALDRLTIDG